MKRQIVDAGIVGMPVMGNGCEENKHIKSGTYVADRDAHK